MYQQKPLNYSENALEPYISSEIINLHYHKHYLNYLKKLNELLNSVGYHESYTKEELVSHIDEFPLNIRGDILYNLGGVINHELYFDSMSPSKASMDGKLKDQAIKQYGSVENFVDEIRRQANLMVGSGYTFLVLNSNKELEIIDFSNQETPYSYGLIPIMALDLWEHAYYLQYKNERNKYIDAFLKIIDWNQVNKRYEQNI